MKKVDLLWLLATLLHHCSDTNGFLPSCARTTPLRSSCTSHRASQRDDNEHDSTTAAAVVVVPDERGQQQEPRFVREAKEALACLEIAVQPYYSSLGKPLAASDTTVITAAIVEACDAIDALAEANASITEVAEKTGRSNGDDDVFVNRYLGLRRRAWKFQRHEWLCRLLRNDYGSYVATASFLSPSRIPRDQLPNVEDVPMVTVNTAKSIRGAFDLAAMKDDTTGEDLLPDCELEAVGYRDNPLDVLLLRIFRKLVEQNTGGIASDKPGIEGLLEQGRKFMLLSDQTPEAQHAMVRKTLGGLMTPVLPPFYRVFMAGVVPDNLGTKWDGKQLGPWFYAPWLTSVVTPPFFRFLVGPSTPNRRKDGQLGGLLVQKCKFLQESNCKGLCLHQCKLPAEQYFMEELGLALTVSPNFATQECQWSFGQIPLPPAEDPSFPSGCLAGCESRRALRASSTAANSANGIKTNPCSY